jgi:hypothetical protein
MREGNPNSFNLVGDGDDVEVIETVEEVFGVKIGNDEAERMRTFGDLLDCVERKLDLTGSRTCLLRQAFLDLRGVTSVPDGLGLRPSLPLTALGEGEQAVRQHLDPWERQRAEQPWRSTVETAGLVALFGGPFLLIAWITAGLAGLGIMLLVLATLGSTPWPDRRSAPATVGALLRSNFHHLYPTLSRRHGPGLACDRWSVLEAICRGNTGYGGPVNRDTTFFSHHFPEGAR